MSTHALVSMTDNSRDIKQNIWDFRMHAMPFGNGGGALTERLAEPCSATFAPTEVFLQRKFSPARICSSIL